MKAVPLSLFHQGSTTLPLAGQSLWWEENALFLSSTHRHSLFYILFALGTEVEVRCHMIRRKERRQRKKVTKVRIFMSVSWNENSHGRERESEELLSSLGLPFMLFLWLRTESLTNCVLWNLEYSYSQGILLYARDTNLQSKSVLYFCKINWFKIFESESFEFLCSVKLLAQA